MDPDLLGRPLAGPTRRLFGVLLDFVVLGLLFPLRAAVSVLLGGIMDLLVALAVAWLLFHLSSTRSHGKVPARGVRWLLRGAALVIALVGVAGFFEGGGSGDQEPPRPAASDSVPGLPSEIAGLQDLPGVSGARIDVDGRSIPFAEIAGGIGDIVTLTRARSAEDAQPVANRMATSLHRMGASASEIREALVEMMSSRVDSSVPWTQEVAARATARIDSIERQERMAADSVLVRYGRALTAGDTAAANSLRPRLRNAVAGGELAELRDENDRLEEQLEEARSTSGLLDRAVTLLTDDLGIGLGWLGLYFTVFLALWGGRTPGKRLLGMQVVQLNGEPLGWWASFERFGGYAAGVATGLMGFAEILWDPNRQAIHDKIAGTVVVRTRGKGYETWKKRAERRMRRRRAGGSGRTSKGAATEGEASGRDPGDATGPHPHLGTDR